MIRGDDIADLASEEYLGANVVVVPQDRVEDLDLLRRRDQLKAQSPDLAGRAWNVDGLWNWPVQTPRRGVPSAGGRHVVERVAKGDQPLLVELLEGFRAARELGLAGAKKRPRAVQTKPANASRRRPFFSSSQRLSHSTTSGLERVAMTREFFANVSMPAWLAGLAVLHNTFSTSAPSSRRRLLCPLPQTMRPPAIAAAPSSRHDGQSADSTAGRRCTPVGTVCSPQVDKPSFKAFRAAWQPVRPRPPSFWRPNSSAPRSRRKPSFTLSRPRG